ncbi:MAG TPA: hypothetical protein VLH84_04400 [Patescibacteria group bacterium]|nr:hypothetical protein [Patescibacteria group bacterium]
MKFMRRSWPYAVFLLLVAAGLLVARQHDSILDWFVLRDYHAPTAVATLAGEDTMTSYARRLFLVNKPQIDTKQQFNQHCSNTSDAVVVLGCYAGNRQGIYIYNVTDPRLSGVREVTAAHEMLHQAYDRLSKKERTRIDALLQSYYNSSASATIKEQYADYHKTEPGEELNELHSVLGTEVANLPPALEQYYKQYFTDRPRVAGYYQQYETEFTERQDQVDAYDAQLDALKLQIDAKRIDLAAREATISAGRQQLETELHNNQISAYNAAVPGFNAQITAYRDEVAVANQLIDQYNSILNQRNAIAVQEQQLQQALNSHEAAASAQ